MFSLKIHHGGFFTESPGRKYIEGTYNFIDFIDIDLFSVIEIHDMIEKLGYKRKDCVMYYHFKIPNNDLDYGLQALGNDGDVLNLVRYVDKYKLIEVYIEHEHTVLETYWKSPQRVMIEEIVDEGPSSTLVRKPFKKPAKKINRMPLLLDMGEGSDNADDVYGEGGLVVTTAVEEGPTKRPVKLPVKRPFKIPAKKTKPMPVPVDEVDSSVEASLSEYESSSESDDSEDSDYILDDEHVMNDVDVDMKDYYQNIDKDAEWMGSHSDNEEVPDDSHVEEAFGLDDFHSASDSENDSQRKKTLRKLRKQRAKEGKGIDASNCSDTFFVGREFGDKKTITDLVAAHAIATRRQLYIWKNDKMRVRVVCRGKCPTFRYPNEGPKASGLKCGPSPSKLKCIAGKMVKSTTCETSACGKGINEVGGKRIKVGGIKGNYKYEVITCPWTVQISKQNKGREETWTVSTLTDEHTCLQTRDVKLLTNTFLTKEVEERIKLNPNIPIRALKEQLQQKYQLGITTNKVTRAKAKSQMKLKGDFTEQYSRLRDYVLELQRTNEDTTVKIDLERDFNPNETTRQFRRIYVCIGALKKGFKAGLKDLLGLDGCFMKGQYPGQLLTAVGIDANHGTYPLAYAVVEAETTSSWSWFLTCLGDDLDLTPMSNFTFVSDRQKVIILILTLLFILTLLLILNFLFVCRASYQQSQRYSHVLSIGIA